MLLRVLASSLLQTARHENCTRYFICSALGNRAKRREQPKSSFWFGPAIPALAASTDSSSICPIEDELTTVPSKLLQLFDAHASEKLPLIWSKGDTVSVKGTGNDHYPV